MKAKFGKIIWTYAFFARVSKVKNRKYFSFQAENCSKIASILFEAKIMFSKWFEEYRKNSQKTLFLSKLGTFAVFLFAFLSLWNISRAIYFNFDSIESLWTNIIIAAILHLIIGITFLTRFIFLFFNPARSFLYTQIIWLISIALIIGAYIATRFALYGSFFETKATVSFGFDVYPSFLLFADQKLEAFLFIYLLTSPIYRMIIAVVSYFKSK